MIINMNGAKAPETPSPVLQEKTITPETLPTVVGADEGYDGLSQVTINPDTNLKAENIRSGKTIFGVDGTFVGAESSSQLLKGIMGYATFDGSYAEELRTSTIPEDLGYPDVQVNSIIKFFSLGVSVRTLYVDSSFGTQAFLNGGSPSPTKVFPTKIISSDTTGGRSDSSIGGCILGLPEIPSGADTALTYRIDAVIATDGEVTIDDTHWFTNESYKGYYGSEFRLLNTDGSVSNNYYSGTIVHFKRDVSVLSEYTLAFDSTYTVRFYSETPPQVYSSTFGYNLKQIIVPKGLLETYQNAPGWSNFTAKIVEATE